MLKREFKVNLKSLIGWVSVISIFYIIVYVIYPMMISDSNLEMYDKLMNSMDPSLLKIFNFDIASISKVSGWLYSEGFTFLTVFISLYSAILGSNILLKEENDKTIEFLFSKPISKNKIITSKFLVGLINIIIFNTLIFGVNLFGLALSKDLVFNKLLTISFLQLLTCIPIYVITLFISTFLRKSKNSLTISVALVFLSYFLNIIGLLGEKVKIFKYFSLFTLSNYRDYLTNNSISYLSIGISILIVIVFLYGTYFVYNKKEFL